MLDLSGLRSMLHQGWTGTLPEDPMAHGSDLSNASPHIHVVFIGEFKGELGLRYHLVALANETRSGIETQWWIEKLVQASGPAFGYADRSLASIREYDDQLHSYLRRIQREYPLAIDPSDDIQALQFLPLISKVCRGQSQDRWTGQ
jgi:hypothetical protein